MKTKLAVLFLVLLHILEVNAQTQPVELVLTDQCPEEIPVEEFSHENSLYFTLPNDSEDLSIWVFQEQEILQTPISLNVNSMTSMSPNGDYIVAISTDVGHNTQNLFYDYFGAEIQEILFIDTVNYQVITLDLPEWISENRYVKRIQWINDSKFSLVSTTEEISTLEIEIYDQTIEAYDWDLPNITLVYPDGETRLSPDGLYTFYTTNNAVEERSWSIANREGEIMLSSEQLEHPYETISWLQDSSGVIMTYRDGRVVVLYLDGIHEVYQYALFGILDAGGVPNAGGDFVAYIGVNGYFDPSNSGTQRSLVILQTDEPNLIAYCNPSLRNYLGSWSNNDLLTYIAVDSESTQIQILNIHENTVTSLIPDVGDTLDIFYVRLIGWS